jgi:hypothetical protein
LPKRRLMDNAIALVRAYLNVNGHFTVTEYPAVEAMRGRSYRTVTDLDILAFRFPVAGRQFPATGRKHAAEPRLFTPDAALGEIGEQPDVIIGAVKEGRAELNPDARAPEVLAAALRRLGCCRAADMQCVAEALLREGRVMTRCGLRIRMAAESGGIFR